MLVKSRPNSNRYGQPLLAVPKVIAEALGWTDRTLVVAEQHHREGAVYPELIVLRAATLADEQAGRGKKLWVRGATLHAHFTKRELAVGAYFQPVLTGDCVEYHFRCLAEDLD